MTHRQPKSAINAALVMLAFAAACGGGGGTNPTPTPTLAPSPTPTTALLTIAPSVPAGLGFAAGSDGVGYLVAFGAPRDRSAPDIVGVHLSAAGAMLDAAPFLISTPSANPFLGPDDAAYSDPAVAFDGEDYGVVWFGSGYVGGSGSGQVEAAVRIASSGTVAAPATELTTRLNFGMCQSALVPPPAAAGISAGIAVVWPFEGRCVNTPALGGLSGVLLSVDNGSLVAGATFGLTPQPVTTVVDAAPAAIASNGAVALAAWNETQFPIDDPRHPDTHIEGALLQPGMAVERERLSSATADITTVASDGDDFLVAWTQSAAAQPPPATEIRALRYRIGSGVLDPDGGFLIAGGPETKSLGGAAFAAHAYLVVWTEASAVRAARVQTDGTVATPFTIDAGPAADATAVATNGDRFLVLFERPTTTDTVALLGTFVDVE